jgi:endonuclease/exonuclease/phosphatase family metal-dependent hydrolase
VKQGTASFLLALIVATLQVAVVGILMFILQPFGERGPTFLAVAGILGFLEGVRWFSPFSRVPGAPVAGSLRSRRSIVSRRLLSSLLLAWLGLIAWAEISPGGQDVGPKAAPTEIRVVTWNILRGADDGWPWLKGGWPARKMALASALARVRPDILCVQEALPQQVEFLERTLPTHCREGVGRDDGRSAGEHCAIFFDRDRFDKIDGGTFWLEAPCDRPAGWQITASIRPNRICTWVRLRDHLTGLTFRVFNTHLYLTEGSRQRAARLILDRMTGGDPREPILLAGDFNATEAAPSRRIFTAAKLASTSALTRQPTEATYQFYGIPFRNLDEILAGPGWQARRHEVLKLKPGNRYPSDHFGVMVDLAPEAHDPEIR